jgi:putative peptide zinc metalloprotease protein
MNLAEALNSALPELPARGARDSYPQIHPDLVIREEIEQGKPLILALVRGTSNLFRLSPAQYQLIQLFDGTRSYEEVAELYHEQTGVSVSAADIREFATSLDENGFWYRSGHERNLLLMEKLSEERKKRTKRKRKFDVAHLQFSAWDPNRFMDKVLPYVEFMFSGWAVAIMLLMFVLMGFIYVDRWGEIWSDTWKYYTFTDKSFRDLAEFWLLFLFLGFFHESSHGLACKHYGGEVHHMGFHLIYLAPAFFVDVTEAWVHANRWQRIMVVLAGIWIELVFCAIATFVWWGTPAGSPAHEFAYKVILITGLAVVLVNMNPLIKLDGYFVLTELVAHGELKESSTGLVSSWVKKHIFCLPGEVEFVPKKRRPFYVLYAVISGIYSYTLLFVVVRFTYNVFVTSYPEWAIVPAAGIAFFIFQSRLRMLGRFMKVVYMDKKDRLRKWFSPIRLLVTGALVLMLLVAPLRRVSVSGQFVITPSTWSVMRANVPGTVVAVSVDEGDRVRAGQPILTVENLPLQSEAALLDEQRRIADARAVQAETSYRNVGSARSAAQGLLQEEQILDQKLGKVTVRSPIEGTILTPRLRDKIGAYLQEGEVIGEVGDTSEMTARIYVPEYELRYVHPGAEVHLRTSSRFAGIKGTVLTISPAAEEAAAGLESVVRYKGLHPPPYYVVDALVPNPNEELRSGMTGDAKIFSSRQSMAYFAAREVREFVSRKVW